MRWDDFDHWQGCKPAEPAALLFVDLALCWCAIAGVGRRRVVFCTGKRVAPISRTRLLLEEMVNCFRLEKGDACVRWRRVKSWEILYAHLLVF